MLKVKFENSDELLKVLRTAENILSVNTAENKLKFIKFSNVGGKLQICAINPYMRLYYVYNKVSSIEGKAGLYDYKTLLSLLGVIQGELTIDDGAIKCKKCSYKIPCVDDSDYPDDILPEITNFAKVDGNKFITALEKVFPATDKILNGSLSGVHMNNNKLLACDSKRIVTYNLELNESINDTILPKDLVKEMLRLPFGNKIYLTKFGENIIAQDENITIMCAKLVDKYPKVEQLLPKSVSNEINIKNEDLYNALVMITPIMDNDVKQCYLKYDNEKMFISADNGVDSAVTDISIHTKNNINEKIEVKFNAQLLLDMLKASDKEIKMETYSDNIGYKFTSGSVMQYIMPIVN